MQLGLKRKTVIFVMSTFIGAVLLLLYIWRDLQQYLETYGH